MIHWPTCEESKDWYRESSTSYGIFRLWKFAYAISNKWEPYHFYFECIDIMTIEILLNKLIEKWRNVFWHKDRINAEKCKYSEWIFYEFENHNMSISLRELVSKDSWLRQFCCENKLVKEDCSSIELYIISEWYWIMTDSYYQFWLMMCSLKDESELEQFLIDNIKI